MLSASAATLGAIRDLGVVWERSHNRLRRKGNRASGHAVVTTLVGRSGANSDIPREDVEDVTQLLPDTTNS
jgi:hypothetical protein